VTKAGAAVLVALALAGAASAAPPKVATVIGVPGVPPVFLAVRSYVALDRNLYARHGANVKLQDFATGIDAMQAVENGQIAMAWAPTAVVLAAIARGAPLVAIEGMDKVDWVIGSLDPAVSSCADLKGQTIGVDAIGGARYDALIAMLASCGLSIHDVKTAELPGAMGLNAQAAGQLSLDVEHYDEVAQVQALGKQVSIVARMTDTARGQHYEMLVVRKDSLGQNRSLYINVLEGDIAATRWLYDSKNLAAASRIARITGEGAQVTTAALHHYVATDWWDVRSSGLTSHRIAQTIALNLKLGVIPSRGHTLTPEAVCDSTLWQAAAAAVGRRLSRR
jgi:NitT/TauT family transport system substrate-binding protein